MILCSDKSSERNLSCFFDMRKPRKMEHLQKEEPFSFDPYFSTYFNSMVWYSKKKEIKNRCEIGINLTATAAAFLFEALELLLFQILICKAYDSETLKFA